MLSYLQILYLANVLRVVLLVPLNLIRTLQISNITLLAT
jgi:hypothetical protein